MAVHYVVEAKLAHFTVIRTELTTTVKLAIVNLLLGISALAIDEISIICSIARSL